jgi:WD40 repeat protein
VTPDGARALSGSDDHALKLWDLQTGAELGTLNGHALSVTAVAVTPDGAWALSGSDDHALKLWDLQTGAELRTLNGHAAGVEAVAVMPDGTRAVSASVDRTLKLWDLKAGRELATFTTDEPLFCCAVAKGGECVVAGRCDRTPPLSAVIERLVWPGI